MVGCLRNIFAFVGCLVVLAAGGVVAWEYRAEVVGFVRSVTGGERRAVRIGVPGAPSPQALRSAERKQREIARRGGPPYVTLSAEEMASLIESRLDPAARLALDSLTVALDEARFALQGSLRTDVFTRELLGPLAELVETVHPFVIAGPASVRAPGQLAWEVDAFVIRAFPLPRSAIPPLLNKLTGRSDGVFVIPVPGTVGDVRIRPDGVRFYREDG